MRRIVAVLDNIRSAHNVGSILRTADGAGIVAVYLCGITPAPVDALGRPRPEVSKVALGAERYVPWQRSASTARVLTKLKAQRYYIVALEQAAEAKSLRSFRVPATKKHIALVVGNEVNGLSAAILKKADAVLEIPMHGQKESLNVSVAFGIAAYALI